ncbi:NADPH-dependent FMN reductase [Solicola gregarius]|uniref:NAD(P)H-dependent oxidoreductase n=1 Tax=Solicola gregarius TaxID=2908642 RepID=A0AA46YL88_9ACTN|nr:NAD(P)H-dependent oxidoreductase [Solicola gregarius]UYM05276.1 NAD(P)H-dependent oxidoreductase [Solicola gregarius]
MKVGIIIGSIREGRTGEQVAVWVEKAAANRTDAEYGVLDLKDFDLPLLTSATVPGAANRQYDSVNVTRWSQAIDAYDAFVFVTPEYNHGIPGAFKNAFDTLGPEWTGKTVAFVSYGADGGVRATEQWRQVTANLHLHDVRASVALGLFSDFDETGLAPLERRDAELSAMLDELTRLTARLG